MLNIPLPIAPHNCRRPPFVCKSVGEILHSVIYRIHFDIGAAEVTNQRLVLGVTLLCNWPWLCSNLAYSRRYYAICSKMWWIYSRVARSFDWCRDSLTRLLFLIHTYSVDNITLELSSPWVWVNNSSGKLTALCTHIISLNIHNVFMCVWPLKYCSKSRHVSGASYQPPAW